MENKAFTEQLLQFVKLNAEVTAAQLSVAFGMTKEGARQHLLKLESVGLVEGNSRSEGVGRPITYYQLTNKGLSRFPDAHAQVTVELLRSVKKLLGENALDLLISDREQQTYKRYLEALDGERELEQKLEKLTKMRSDEGYMAAWEKHENSYYLTENHCPICAAATECQGFCRAELKNFRQLIGEEYKVDRVKHIVTDGQRCVYEITPVQKN